jgi:membrane fusion protein, heavy metal efflux system
MQPSPAARLRRHRLWFVAIGGTVAALLAVWAIDTSPSNALMRPASAKAADGAFQPTTSQWSGLGMATVGLVTFREERSTDGKIGINEDTTTPVFSPYSGRVSRLIAKAGDQVERGAPLFAIEANEFVQGQNDLITAVAGVEKARSRLTFAQAAEKRQKELLAIRGGALKELELAQSDLVAAQGDFRAADISLAAVRNRLRILGRSDAEIDRLEKEDRIGAETIVTAPIAGTVLQRKVGLGQYINAGAPDPVFAIGDLAKVWLIANVREGDAPKMKPGAPVDVAVLAYPGRTFSARLDYVSPSLDPTTRRELLPEMFASFQIVTGASRTMPAVPQSAVVYEGAGARVWVASPESKTVASRSVEVGSTANGMVEIRSGLAAGEVVVTTGALFIDRAAKRD